MLLEKLTALVGDIPPGCEGIVYVVACLILLYILDEFVSLLKIAFRGLR